MNSEQLGLPKWWHHHGIKLGISNRDGVFTETGILLLVSNVVEVHLFEDLRDGLWTVTYEINHGGWDRSEGVVRLTKQQIEIAFCINDLSQLLDRGTDIFGLFAEGDGMVGFHGKFIRRGDYLNIPCTGTGSDGDPNVSIFLSDDIKEAVRSLLPR